jgi:hypothetical protein
MTHTGHDEFDPNKLLLRLFAVRTALDQRTLSLDRKWYLFGESLQQTVVEY